MRSTKTEKNYRLDVIFLVSVLIIGLGLTCIPLWIQPDSTSYIVNSFIIRGAVGHIDDSWPPMTSLALALFSSIFNIGAITSFKLINLISFTGTMLVWKAMYMRVFNGWFQYMALLFLLMSYELWMLTSTGMSEMLFLFLASVALLYVVRHYETEDSRLAILLLFAAGFFMSLASLTRYLGAGLAIGVICFLVSNLNRKGLKTTFAEVIVFSLAYTPPVLLWFLRNKIITGHYSFVERWDIGNIPPWYHQTELLVRNFFGSTIGTPTLNKPLSYASIICFLTLGAITILRLNKQANKQSIVDVPVFKLSLICIFSYTALVGYFYVFHGSDYTTPRYFAILQPLVYLVILAAIFDVLSSKNYRNLLSIFTYSLFVGLLLLTTYRTYRKLPYLSNRPNFFDKNLYFNPSPASLETLEWYVNHDNSDSIYISNFDLHLRTLDSRIALPLISKETNQKISDYYKLHNNKRVYLVYNVNHDWRDPWLDADWQQINGLIDCEKIKEDAQVVICEVR